MENQELNQGKDRKIEQLIDELTRYEVPDEILQELINKVIDQEEELKRTKEDLHFVDRRNQKLDKEQERLWNHVDWMMERYGTNIPQRKKGSKIKNKIVSLNNWFTGD